MQSLNERPCGSDGAGEIAHLPIELLFVDRFENLSHRRPGAHPELEQMPPEKYRPRWAVFDT